MRQCRPFLEFPWFSFPKLTLSGTFQGLGPQVFWVLNKRSTFANQLSSKLVGLETGRCQLQATVAFARHSVRAWMQSSD